MGTSNSVYIGFYIEVLHLQKDVTKERYIHPDSGNVMETPFDPISGVKCKVESYTTREIISPIPYIEEDGYDYDMFWEPAYTGMVHPNSTFILNMGNKYAKSFDSTRNVEISGAMDIKTLLIHFKREYRKYLDYYIKKYGRIEVKYGVVYYAH